jgi:hypothetical protein
VSTRAHILVSLVNIASLLFILRLVRRRQLRAKYSLLWLSVGFAFVVLGVSPGLLDWAAGKVGIAYQPALLFLVGDVFLLLVVVHLSWEISRLEDRTRVLSEELALVVERTDVLTAEVELLAAQASRPAEVPAGEATPGRSG